MKAYVFTVKEDICVANGRDTTAANLLEKMKLYGSVEDYDTVISRVTAEYQRTVDGLKSQLETTKSQQITADELKLISVYREGKNAVEKESQDKISALKKSLEDVRAESESRIEKIRAAIDAK